MNKITKILSIILVTILCISTLSACSSGTVEENYNGAYDNAFGESNDFSDIKGEDFISDSIGSMNPSQSTDSSTNAGTTTDTEKPTSQKIIQTFNFEIETTDFDKCIIDLEDNIAKSEGYIEKSNVTGNDKYYTNTRYASYTIRIPVSNSNNFKKYIEDNCIVRSKEVSTKDITTTYVDTESRIKALKTEKEVLEKLLSEAKNMSDLLTIQNQLTDVIYEIESYSSKLKTYDNLVDYVTIYLTIDEVEKPTVVEEKTIWQEISENLSENTKAIIDDFVELFIFLVSSIPYLVVLAIFVVPFILIILHFSKKNKKKKINNDTTPTEPTQNDSK